MSQIQDININRVEVKLADTDDPLASRIDWDPLNSGGANFKTQWLEKSASSLMRVRPTIGARLFALVFMLPGLGGLVIGVPYHFIGGDFGAGLFFIAWGGVFFGAGMFMWYQFSRGFVFDKTAGRYFKGKDYDRSRRFSDDKQGRLSDIHALQMLTERVTSSSSKGGSSSYKSYEINLVLENGRRVNVMDHGNLSEIESSAREMARFLDVPVWRASYGGR